MVQPEEPPHALWGDRCRPSTSALQARLYKVLMRSALSATHCPARPDRPGSPIWGGLCAFQALAQPQGGLGGHPRDRLSWLLPPWTCLGPRPSLYHALLALAAPQVVPWVPGTPGVMGGAHCLPEIRPPWVSCPSGGYSRDLPQALALQWNVLESGPRAAEKGAWGRALPHLHLHCKGVFLQPAPHLHLPEWSAHSRLHHRTEGFAKETIT